MTLRVALAALAVLLASGPAAAQGWPYSSRSPYYEPPSRYYNYPPPRQYGYFSNFGWDGYDDYRSSGPRVQSGGGKPAITPIPAQRISFVSTYPVDSVIIDHRGRQLLLVVSDKEALRYPISVGREGFSWTGTETISRLAEWPDWHPPEEMRGPGGDHFPARTLPQRCLGRTRTHLHRQRRPVATAPHRRDR
jgi:lipoprotein-anchoring transpeptidase ErfK/SrfK